MSRRDDTVPMRHMLDYAREAVALVRQRSRADLDADRLLQLGLRQIIQVRPPGTRELMPGILARARALVHYGG